MDQPEVHCRSGPSNGVPVCTLRSVPTPDTMERRNGSRAEAAEGRRPYQAAIRAPGMDAPAGIVDEVGVKVSSHNMLIISCGTQS